MGWRILKFIEHLFYRRHRHGRGIHSPYLFDLVHGAIFNAKRIAVPEGIRTIHHSLLKDPTLIPALSVGQESKVDRAGNRSVASFARGSSVSPKYGALLLRVSRWFQPEMVIELGTGLGISTLYLSAGSPGIPLHTLEGNPHRAEFSEKLIKRSGLKGVKVHRGAFEELLPVLEHDLKGRYLAFMDGNHSYEPTLRYMRTLLGIAGEEALVILDDIHWSREMHRAWKEVCSWPETRVSVDLFHMGILLLRRDLQKARVKIKF